MQPYRLEVAVKRVHGLAPLVAITSSKVAVEVHFLDFPTIVIHPQGYVVGDTVVYNVCHKADFRMTADQAASVFPALCQCNLSAESDVNLSRTAQWSCPCSLIPSSSAGGGGVSAAPQPQRTYANCVIRNTSGETLGYAEMSCVVLSLAPQPQQAPPPQPHPSALARWTPEASYAPPAPAASPPQPPQPSPSPTTQRPHAESEQGKPYIVRVVVGESDRRRRGGGRLIRDDAGGDDVAAAAPHDGNRRGSPDLRVSASTASNESLLYVLQYEVAYQLQSLSETTAAALQREHEVLTRTPLTNDGNDGRVSTAKLTKSIDRSVAQMVKLANIVLQVANQLIDSSPAPPHTGTSREIKDLARQKRNPVNKLPVPAAKSVGYYLQYDVLYQLQCLGTNLIYVTLAYREALDAPLSAIPKQHADFCVSLGSEVQHLTKLLNILIQSSVDGTLGNAAASVSGGAVMATDTRKRKTKPKHRSNTAVAPTAKPPARALSVSGIKSSRSSSSISSYSSFTRSSSSSSSSSDASLNRPMTPVSAPPALPVAAVAHPPPIPTLPTQHSPPAPHTFASPPIISPVMTPSAVPPQPQVSPPPYATVAAPLPAVSVNSALDSPPRDTSQSFISVPGATPFSWVNAINQDQRNASLSSPSPPPLTTPVPPTSSAMYGATGVTFATQPAAPAFAPPTLSAPQLSIAPPRLSLPSPLTPPTAIPSPSVVPTPAHLAPPAPPPLAPAGIPIPLPIPR